MLTPPGIGLLSDSHTWLAAFVLLRRGGGTHKGQGAAARTLGARLSASYAKMEPRENLKNSNHEIEYRGY